MKIKKIIILIILFSVNFLTETSSKENKILLKLNNEIITTIDILNEINFLSIMNEDFSKIEKDRQIEIAKNSLIREKIKFIEITKFRENIKINDNIYEKITKNYFKSFNFDNVQDLENYFKSKNLNPKFIKKKISIDTLWKQFIFEKFSKNVKIDKKEIEQILKNKEKQKEYFLSEIVFNVSENEKLSKKTNVILKTIEEKSFSEAAYNFSISETSKNGGKLGWIKEGIVSDLINKELKKINIGEFTDPIVIPSGFLILYVENIREIENNFDIEDELKNIIDKKTNDQLNQFSNIYINKLKRNIQLNEI